MMLFGKNFHQVDEKGRIRIPSKFREALGDNILIMNAPCGCLYVFSAAEAERIFSKLDDALLSDDEAQSTMKILFSNTENPEEDKQGRIPLTKEQIKHAGITKNIVTIGAGRRAEIWSAEKWEDFNSKNNDVGSALKSLAKYGV